MLGEIVVFNDKIVDGHLDIAWNYQSLKRDFLSSADDKAALDSDAVRVVEGVPAVGLPDLRRGNFGIVCASIWVEPADSVQPSMGRKYENIDDARAMAAEQLGYYELIDRQPDVRIVRGRSDIRECLDPANWSLGLVLSIEGADFIQDADDLRSWYDNGVRMIAPVWQKNVYGGCANLGGSLSSKGRELLRQMSSLEIVLDIAHMSDECADEAASSYDGVVVSSHSSCRSLCDGARQISDLQIARVHESGGLVGLMLWNKVIDARKERVNLKDLFRHMGHIHKVTGSWDSVGIGSSLDGGFGTESLPTEMRNIGDCSKIGDYLLGVGLLMSDVEKVMFRNWERVLNRSFA